MTGSIAENKTQHFPTRQAIITVLYSENIGSIFLYIKFGSAWSITINTDIAKVCGVIVILKTENAFPIGWVIWCIYPDGVGCFLGINISVNGAKKTILSSGSGGVGGTRHP